MYMLIMIITTSLQVIYMLILIMAVFFLCWTPILTYNTLAAFELLGFGNSGKIFKISKYQNITPWLLSSSLDLATQAKYSPIKDFSTSKPFHCDTGTGRTKHLKTTFSLLSYLNRLVQFLNTTLELAFSMC